MYYSSCFIYINMCLTYIFPNFSLLEWLWALLTYANEDLQVKQGHYYK